jgi:hypothetical protein
LYDTLGEEASEFILNQTQSPIIVASVDHVPHLIKMKDKLPSLKIIVSMDDLDEGDLPGRSKGDLLRVWAKEKGLQLLSFHDGSYLVCFLNGSGGSRRGDSPAAYSTDPTDCNHHQLHFWYDWYAKRCCLDARQCRRCTCWS